MTYLGIISTFANDHDLDLHLTIYSHHGTVSSMRGECFVEWFSLLVEPLGICPFHPDKSYSSSYPRPSRYKMHLIFSGVWRPQFCPVTRGDHVSWVGFLDARLVYLGPKAALNTTTVNYLVCLSTLETAWVSSLPLMDRDEMEGMWILDSGRSNSEIDHNCLSAGDPGALTHCELWYPCVWSWRSG